MTEQEVHEKVMRKLNFLDNSAWFIRTVIHYVTFGIA